MPLHRRTNEAGKNRSISSSRTSAEWPVQIVGGADHRHPVDSRGVFRTLGTRRTHEPRSIELAHHPTRGWHPSFPWRCPRADRMANGSSSRYQPSRGRLLPDPTRGVSSRGAQNLCPAQIHLRAGRYFRCFAAGWPTTLPGGLHSNSERAEKTVCPLAAGPQMH